MSGSWNTARWSLGQRHVDPPTGTDSPCDRRSSGTVCPVPTGVGRHNNELSVRDRHPVRSPLKVFESLSITIHVCLRHTPRLREWVSRHLFLPSHRKSDERPSKGSNPLRPNPSVILPPEILDKVLENALVNRSDKRTLFTCALVATWWTGPSQRRLFSSVAISEDNYKRWMNGVVLSKSKVRLSEYVQSLVHHGFLRDDYRTLGLPQDSGEYLSALRNLRSLTLTEIRVQYFSEEEFRTGFSAFRESLTYLFLDNFSTSFSAFVALVGYFPNITTLRLDLFEMEPDEGPVPSLSRPLRGKLQFIDIHNPDLEFYGRFSNLDLEYEELVIGCSSRCPAMGILERALRISPSTVKFLTLPAGTTCR